MSENIDGGLGFVATLDLKDFNISAEAMERRIRKASTTTVDESARMEQAITNFAQNGARYIIGTLVGGGMMGLVNSIVQTRGQFQQLSIAFETMLGSGSKAQTLMDQIVNTAAKTPFDLLGLANGAKQLMAYGAEANKVNDVLVRLGNIASGLSIPLNDIVYLYGTTMVQGRLYANDVRQFTGRGIPLVKELAAMYGKTTEEINNMVSAGKIGFSDVEKVLNKLTDSGGQFYNLMEKQSKSLSGMVSNLGDAWDNALNKLGEQNQDVLAAGISGATYLVENLEEVLRVVKSIAIAYGSYKAAIVLNTLTTKGYTGIALIDNTVKQAKIALLKTEEAAFNRVAAAEAVDTAAKKINTATTVVQTKATLSLSTALKALWITMKANPFGWIITLAGMAYSAFTLFSSKTDETTKELSGMAKMTKTASDNFAEEAGKIDALQKILNSSNGSYQKRNEAILELKKIIPDYNAELTKEGKIINDNTEAINKYLTQLEKQIKLKTAQEELEAAYKAKRSLEKDESTQSDKYWNIRQTNTLQGYDRNSTTSKLSRLFGMENEDNAKKNLDETRKKLSEIESTISSLNKEINTTSLEMENLNKTQTEVESENSINKKIKDLQDERAAIEINSAKYKELTKLIQDEQNKLPKNKGSEEALRNEEQLSEKQKEVYFKTEQARIEIMEDGFEKRKALLDLQHQQTIESIDKEERDLIKARKAAGKNGLSSDEKNGFSDRRKLENESYAKDQNKLFDGEIDYKKKQYELYFRWVKNMGKDVADTQFSNLLKGGSSYKDYIEKQIKELNQKKTSGSLTEGEGNHLIALNVQYDEIRGAKSAMDSFKESVTQAIGRAATLAEKIQAIADAKDKLSNGSTGLVGDDEKAEANLFVSKEEEDANKELQDRVLNDFRSFEEKKKSIQNEYALLKNSETAQNNAALLAEINKGEVEALSALNAQMLMQTDSWNNLFSDLDSLTVDKIDSLITEIQEKMSTADLNLNPADMKAVLDKLDQAKQKILDVNPFKAMGKAIKATLGTAEQKSKHSSGNIKTDWSNLAKATEGCFDFVNDAISSCDVLSDLIGDSGKATIQMVQGIATAGIAMSAAIKTAETGSVILLAISIALQAIQWIASLFNNDDELEEKIQNIQGNIDSLSNSFDRLENAMSRTYWVYNDEEKEAHEKRLNSINQQIAALEEQKKVAAASWNFVEYANLTKQIKELRYELEKAEQTGDMFQLYELQQKNLIAQQDLIKQQIEAENNKKKTDSGKIADWEEQLKDIDTQLKDMELQMLETLAGTDIKSAIDEFADALVDAYCKGEDAAIALGEVTKKTMKNAVVEALKRQYLAKGIEEATKYLGSAMGDGVLTDEERSKFESLVNMAGNEFNSMLNGIGDWIKDIPEDKDEDAMTGAVKSLSEETGGIIAGRLNAMVINQSDSNSILRQSLLYHQEIAVNTRYNRHLEGIHEALIEIKNNNNGGSLLSQGIS